MLYIYVYILNKRFGVWTLYFYGIVPILWLGAYVLFGVWFDVFLTWVLIMVLNMHFRWLWHFNWLWIDMPSFDACVYFNYRIVCLGRWCPYLEYIWWYWIVGRIYVLVRDILGFGYLWLYMYILIIV